jgi:tRNA threonylcarbamoyladenosine biosynthesis protein TsaB
VRVLIIETSTERGVIAYCDGDAVVYAKELPFGLHQSKYVMPAVEEACRFIDDPSGLNAIAVGVGPGSYTGIRIGVAVAQGLAYSWKVPLLGLSSLIGFVPMEQTGPFVALVDARIGGVYFQRGLFADGQVTIEEKPQICSLEKVPEFLSGMHLVTPTPKVLQRIFALHGEQQWTWEERGPSISALLMKCKEEYKNKTFVFSPSQLELFYLRETEAERNFDVKGKQ